MKKKLFLFLVAISISFSSFARQFEIMGIKSGMTKDQVEQIVPLEEKYGSFCVLDSFLKEKNVFFDKSISFRFTDEGILYYLEAYSYYDGKKFSELALLSILKEKYPDAKISSGTDSTNKKEYYGIVTEDEKVIYDTVMLNKERLVKGKKF